MNAYATVIPELEAAIGALPVIDTHEHLPAHEAHREQDTDVLREYLTHYFNRDLISAGLPRADFEKARDASGRSGTLAERWALVSPYWEACRLTGYGRALDLSAQGIYGIERIDGGSIEALNAAFLQTLHQPHYRRVLKDLCGIQTSVLDAWTVDADADYFSPAFNIAGLVRPNSDQLREGGDGATAGLVTMPVRSYGDWLDVCDATLDTAIARGAACFKSAMAYDRSLAFPRVTFAEAEADFQAALSPYHRPDWNTQPAIPGEAFQCYTMHHVLRGIERRGKALQVHTGLQEGNGNLLANSNPLLLSNLFLEYPDLHFDIFHMAYPFMGELSALCKNFPNVFIDMCWGHIISPRASMLALDEWLDAVPYNKISAFGGDYCFIDGVYGHLALARQNVGKTLSRKVLAHEITLDQAQRIAHALFYENPKRVLRL